MAISNFFKGISLFKSISDKCLGVDIGTFSIKMVELSRIGERRKLENYGEIESEMFYKKPFRTVEKNILSISSKDISKGIDAIREEAKISSVKAIFSIPDFSTFFTNFELPAMRQEELSRAIEFEARRYSPLPPSEVIFDWKIIGDLTSIRSKDKIKILLAIIPNEVVNQYQEVAEFSGLKLVALEAEIFELARALNDKNKKSIILVDFGAQTTTLTIVNNGSIEKTQTIDVSGNELTQVLSRALNIDYKKAENLKKKYGLKISKFLEKELEKSVGNIFEPLIDPILNEIEKMVYNFYQTTNKDIDQIILAGGTALLNGLKEYFFIRLQKEIIIANPFTDIFYPSILRQKLEEMGPSFAIATGTALRGLE